MTTMIAFCDCAVWVAQGGPGPTLVGCRLCTVETLTGWVESVNVGNKNPAAGGQMQRAGSTATRREMDSDVQDIMRARGGESRDDDLGL